MSDDGARVLQRSDAAATEHRWRLRYAGDGYFRVESGNSGRVLTAAGRDGEIVLRDDNGASDQSWRFV